MTSADYQLSIDRGGVFEVAFRLRDENGSPIDLSNSITEFQIKPSYDAAATIDLDSEGSQVVVNEESSTVSVNLTSAQTATLTASSYVFYFQTISGGQIRRWVRGSVVVKD